MPREITHHRDGQGLNQKLTIQAMDEPKAGAGSYEYNILNFETGDLFLTARFQRGPLKESGPNGITPEALLALVIERLGAIQTGPAACDHNAAALAACRLAMTCLKLRTADERARGV
jgi:hypothetical protein